MNDPLLMEQKQGLRISDFRLALRKIYFGNWMQDPMSLHLLTWLAVLLTYFGVIHKWCHSNFLTPFPPHLTSIMPWKSPPNHHFLAANTSVNLYGWPLRDDISRPFIWRDTIELWRKRTLSVAKSQSVIGNAMTFLFLPSCSDNVGWKL